MRPIAIACAIAVLAGCYNKEHHTPTDPVYAGAVQLSQSATSIPADGVSRVTITAQLSPATSSANRTVSFHATTGFFVGVPDPSKDTTANADSAGIARVELRSTTAIETAIVTATVSGITQSVTVAFTAVNPDDVIRVSTSSSQVPADGFSRVTITAQLGPTTSATVRPVVFTASTGTLVGAPGDAKTLTVNADNAGVARAELRSSKDLETANVTATFGGVTRSVNVAFTATNPADIIRISTTSTQVPADGATVIQVIADVAAGLQGTQREVTFTASTGTFVKTNNTTATETASLDNRAIVDLRAPRTPSSSRLTATVNGVRAETTIAFIPALPQRVEVVAPFSIKANETVTVTAKLSRTPGFVSAERVVTFSAVDADGKTVGVFHNVRLSVEDGTAAATYTPNGTEHRGAIKIRATTESSSGGTITGEASAVIAPPDPPVTTT